MGNVETTGAKVLSGRGRSSKRRAKWNIDNKMQIDQHAHEYSSPVFMNFYDRLHVGIEVHDTEFSYGDGDPGVYNQTPKVHDERDYWFQKLVGFTHLSKTQIDDIVKKWRVNGDFETGKYSLLCNNCHCFSRRFAVRLVESGDNGKHGFGIDTRHAVLG